MSRNYAITYMMKIQNPDVKEELTRRLARIEGQVRGVKAMLAGDRDCHEIMQQLSAIRAAVQSTSRIFLQEFATSCLVDMDDEGRSQAGSELRARREKVVQDMIRLLDKTP